MFPHGFYDPTVTTSAPTQKNSKSPFACIKKERNKSYCERSVDENTEYLFKDAEYAIKNYAPGKMPIGVCDACVHACKVAGVGGKMSTAHMATRDIDKTKM